MLDRLSHPFRSHSTPTTPPPSELSPVSYASRLRSSLKQAFAATWPRSRPIPPSSPADLASYITTFDKSELILASRWAHNLDRYEPNYTSIASVIHPTAATADVLLRDTVRDRIDALYGTNNPGFLIDRADPRPPELRPSDYLPLTLSLCFIAAHLAGKKVNRSYYEKLAHPDPAQLTQVLLDLYLLIDAYRTGNNATRETLFLLSGELQGTGQELLQAVNASLQ